MSFAENVTLSYDGHEVTLPRPVPGYTIMHNRNQAQARTAGGTVKVYDKSFSYYTVELTFEITETQKDNLETFVRDVIVFGLNAFTFTDHHGTVHDTAILNQTELAFEKLASARYSIALRFDLQESIS